MYRSPGSPPARPASPWPLTFSTLSASTPVCQTLFFHSPRYSIYGATAIFSGADLTYQNERKQPMREHKEDRVHLLTAEVDEPIKVRFLAAHPVE